jgi:uncharacterized protein
MSVVEPRPELPPEQIRVLGCLIEKQLTTPQQYPLTLNALTLACNQSSNRSPVVAYDEATVELAVRTLKQGGLTRFVHPVHGRSVLRYEHLLGDVFGLDERQLAILGVLLLRGPQTVGELRTRSERMVAFEALSEVSHEIDLLLTQAGGLVAPVPRRPGQKEGRFVHLLGAGDPFAEAARLPELEGAEAPAQAPMLAAIESLRQEVEALRLRLDEVRSALGMDPGDA